MTDKQSIKVRLLGGAILVGATYAAEWAKVIGTRQANNSTLGLEPHQKQQHNAAKAAVAERQKASGRHPARPIPKPTYPVSRGDYEENFEGGFRVDVDPERAANVRQDPTDPALKDKPVARPIPKQAD
jgi:hypothetical protein